MHSLQAQGRAHSTAQGATPVEFAMRHTDLATEPSGRRSTAAAWLRTMLENATRCEFIASETNIAAERRASSPPQGARRRAGVR